VTDLRVTVAPSALLAIGLGATHSAAAALVWFVALPVAGKAVLTLAIGASLVWLTARNALLHAAQAVVALEARDGALSVQTRGGEWLEGEVLDSSYVSARLTIVNFRPRGGWRARHVILVPDNVDPNEFRRLRTWLRWKRGETAASDPA
jgi:toxin CptA